MDFIKLFLSEYGMTILYTVLTAVASYLGLWVKSLYTKYINDKTKQDVVKTCVKAVEQLYKDLHGEEKYQEVVEASVAMLNEKGITITELELKMLIESAVGEFNKVFKDPDVLAPIDYEGEQMTLEENMD
jgi:hypothetical protein